MTEEEAEKIGCIVFDNEDLITAISETIYDLHARISQCGKCFDPFSEASGEAASLTISKVASAVNSCFGIVFDVTPDDRFGGDVFLQVSTFCARLAKDHIFPDGNKRTALVISLAILQLKGLVISVVDSSDPSENDMYGWIESVVAGQDSVEDLSVTLRERTSCGTYPDV